MSSDEKEYRQVFPGFYVGDTMSGVCVGCMTVAAGGDPDNYRHTSMVVKLAVAFLDMLIGPIRTDDMERDILQDWHEGTHRASCVSCRNRRN